MYFILGHNDEITQLSAIHLEGEETFSSHVLPKNNISSNGIKVTGLSVQMKIGVRVLTQHGRIIPSKDITQALTDFIDWLPQQVVLVAHNGRVFDHPRLLSSIKHCDLKDSFANKVLGLGDSLPILKRAFPEEKSHSLPKLCKSNIAYEYDAHDALADCVALKQIIQKGLTKSKDKLKFSDCFNTSDVYQEVAFKEEQWVCYQTLEKLVPYVLSR